MINGKIFGNMFGFAYAILIDFLILLFQGTCVFLIHHLGKTGANSEAFTVYNMLRYRNRTISKSLHQQILSILIKGRLLKEAYVVFKVKDAQLLIICTFALF